MSLRARFSDLTTCLEFNVQGPRMMATVRETKTSRRSKARLPVILYGPTQWLTGLNWVQTFLEARERMGIPFPQ
eukprot:8391255-Karenia_brevis.AAC.1